MAGPGGGDGVGGDRIGNEFQEMWWVWNWGLRYEVSKNI